MHNMRLSGSYYSIGFSCGKELRASGFTVPHANSVDIRFARDSMQEVRQVFPDVVDEIEGLGLGLKANYKDVVAMVLTNHVIHDDHSVAFAAGSGVISGGATLLARNYNRHIRRPGHNMAIRVNPKGALASIANTDTPIVRQDGMNSKGLAVAGSSVPGGAVGVGMAPTLMMRALLDTCADVGSAVHLLSEAKHARGFNFILADRFGTIALVEVGPKHFEHKSFTKGFVVAANHFQTTGKAKGLDDGASRYMRLKSLIESTKTLNANSAISALSDHKGMICEHGGESGFSTVWTSVFSTGKGKIIHSEGTPCTAERKEYEI